MVWGLVAVLAGIVLGWGVLAVLLFLVLPVRDGGER